MSTRATVHFQKHDVDYAIVYRHSDGYPEGLGKDLEDFLDAVGELRDTRFDDPSYLASKFVVWQAAKYSKGNKLDFLGVGVVLTDPGDIEYRYLVDCKGPRPSIKIKHASAG